MINILIYSNCQGKSLEYFLKIYFKENNLEYNIDIIQNYLLISKKKKINYNLFKNADIFIYQYIDKKHCEYSTDINIKNSLIHYLKDDCKKICFPYIYNNSLWSLIRPAIIDNFISGQGLMNKYINADIIIELKKKYNLEEIIDMYNKNEINFNYENNFKNCINILKEKEKECNIIISDFIIDNIKKHKLFLTQNHPTTIIFVYIINQILIKLNLEKIDYFNYEDFDENITKLPGEYPHSKYDINFWKFNYEVKNINDEYYIKIIKEIYYI